MEEKNSTNIVKEISEDLLTPEEVCKALRGSVSPEGLANWRSAGNPNAPQYVKIGRKVFYKRQDILEFIERQTFTPQGELAL